MVNSTTYTEGVLPHFMKKILNRMANYESLTHDEAYDTLQGITNGLINEAQTIAFISAFVMRRITFEELSGFREALLDQCLKIKLEGSESGLDIVGTGGDGKNTFNISTLSAIVVAASGQKVIKHGNYGSTSISGSSNVLESLGYKFSNNQEVLMKQLDESNICFLHAPLFHPAMKNVAAIRKNLGIRTFFNLLGPLTNPVQPKYQVLGTNSLSIARMYHYLLQDKNREYIVMHNIDGYDEISLTAECKLYGNGDEKLLQPSAFGFQKINAEDIFGGNTSAVASRIFMEILENKGSQAQENVAVANSAIALQLVKHQLTLQDAVAECKELIHSGSALNTFKKMISNS
jgi:anthranilate phosphoribosyltransferase